MPVVVLETVIHAPRRRAFDLARDVGIHCETAASTGERALPPGVTDGLLELGDQVIFEARHLGVRQRLGARIVRMEAPDYFADEMTFGIFKSLYHEHEFEAAGGDGATLMRDRLRWQSPLGFLGVIADKLVVERHLRTFLKQRALALKRIAEDMG